MKGQVVGTDGWILSMFRSWRQSVARGHSKLSLYEYRWPIHYPSEAPLIKAIVADANGRFDFGPLKGGHYTLVIGEEAGTDDKWSGFDRFDIEIKDLPAATEFVLIDVSPLHPDCSGGHKFIVRSK